METGSSLAEMINAAAVAHLAELIGRVHPPFDKAKFKRALARDLPKLALTQRAKRIAGELHVHLPDDFPKAAAILVRAVGPVASRDGAEAVSSFRYLPLLNFVGLYGLDHLEASLDALEHLTCSFTAEFDIRPFLVKYPEQTLQRMTVWAAHSDWRVRRLASEGSRPRLPWGLRLKAFIKDPAPVLAILEHLRADPDLNVRRSVANNLNDIAKDNPDAVIKVARRWMKSAHPHTAWIVRHALRTLIKQGNTDALTLLGYTGAEDVRLSRFRLDHHTIRIGERLGFEFCLTNSGKRSTQLCIDYRIHHRRANGALSPKVFKLAKKQLAAGQQIELRRQHAIVLITTRRYYPGAHQLDIIVNGRTLHGTAFELLA